MDARDELFIGFNLLAWATPVLLKYVNDEHASY